MFCKMVGIYPYNIYILVSWTLCLCIVIHLISDPTDMFWRLWPVAAASEDCWTGSSPVQQRAAVLLNPADHWYSGPALLD